MTNWKKLDNDSPMYEWEGGTVPCFKDDRTERERETHTVLIGGKDRFMSNFGPCENYKNGKFDVNAPNSYAFWACTPEMAERVYCHVSDRDDISAGRYDDGLSEHFERRIMNKLVLCHVYVVTESHPYTSEFIPEV